MERAPEVGLMGANNSCQRGRRVHAHDERAPAPELAAFYLVSLLRSTINLRVYATLSKGHTFYTTHHVPRRDDQTNSYQPTPSGGRVHTLLG